MYEGIVGALREGSKPYHKHKKNGVCTIRPGWNEVVAKHHAEAREAYKSWDRAGRPRQGQELEHKKLTNAKFKYAVRFIHKNEQTMSSMAKKLLNNEVNDFWKVRLLNKSKPSLPCAVDGISGAQTIAELWRKHYSNLFNSVQSDLYMSGNIKSDDSMVIKAHEVYKAINKLSNNKASGPDGIAAENIKYASLKLSPLLGLCFTGFMFHGILPDSMLSVYKSLL